MSIAPYILFGALSPPKTPEEGLIWTTSSARFPIANVLIMQQQ